MPVSNSKFKAPIDIRRDIAGFFGIGSGDLGYLIAHAPINISALFKPIKHAALGFITLAQRITQFHGLIPKEMASIRSTSTFSPVPSPEVWGYDRPTGVIGVAPFRAFDFAHIETDLTKIATDNGYDHTAEAPLVMDEDVSCSLSTDPDSGDWLCPTFKYDEHSVNQYGSANIQIFLRDLIFRYYGNRDGVAFWQLPSAYDDIFNSDGALTTGVWRFAVALALKTGASGPYRWLIISSPEPLSNPFISTQSPTDMLKRVIRPSYNQIVANAIKYVVRNYGQTQIDCIPFLACNLQYSANQGWFFGGSNYDRAITFPKGDKFKLTPTGFATTLAIVYAAFRVAYTNTNDPTQNINNLTWYNGTGIIVSGQAYMAITLPRPTGFNYCIMELTFTANTHFGITSNVVGGIMVNSNDNPGQLYTNDNQEISNISGEWVDSSHTYKVRCMGPTLFQIMSQAPASAFPLNNPDGFDMYLDNNQLAARQHKLEAGTMIALQQ